MRQILIVILVLFSAWSAWHVAKSVPDRKNVDLAYPSGYSGKWKDKYDNHVVDVEDGVVNGEFRWLDSHGKTLSIEDYCYGIPANSWRSFRNPSYVLEMKNGLPFSGEYRGHDMISEQEVYLKFVDGRIDELIPENFDVFMDDVKISKKFNPANCYIFLGCLFLRSVDEMQKYGILSYPVVVGDASGVKVESIK